MWQAAMLSRKPLHRQFFALYVHHARENQSESCAIWRPQRGKNHTNLKNKRDRFDFITIFYLGDILNGIVAEYFNSHWLTARFNSSAYWGINCLGHFCTE